MTHVQMLRASLSEMSGDIHCYSFIRESTHIIAHTNMVYVDSHSLGQLALASKRNS